MDDSDPAENYRTIREELAAYSPTLAAKPEILVGSKMDLTDAATMCELLEEELEQEIIPISAVTGEGIKELMSRILQELAALPDEEPEEQPESHASPLDDL
jgi:GTP-binding protein